jgi:hypothetical protein
MNAYGSLWRVAMSASGHFQTSVSLPIMSGLPSKADISLGQRNVSLVPDSEMTTGSRHVRFALES